MHEITNRLLSAKNEEELVTVEFAGGMATGVITEIDFEHGFVAFKEENGFESVFILNSLIRVTFGKRERRLGRPRPSTSGLY